MNKKIFIFFIIGTFLILIMPVFSVSSYNIKQIKNNQTISRNVPSTLIQGSIQGRVLKYLDDIPMSNVEVKIYSFIPSFFKKTTTDSNGFYNFNIETVFNKFGFYLTAEKSGYEMFPSEIFIEENNFDIKKDLWLALPNSGKIFGKIYNTKNNQPISNIKVSIFYFDDWINEKPPFATTFSLSDGYYEFNNLNTQEYLIDINDSLYFYFIPPQSNIKLGMDGQFEVEFNLYLIRRKTRLFGDQFNIFNYIFELYHQNN